MAIRIRPATPEDLPGLQADLARDKRWEQLDLRRGVVYVAEKDGELVGYIHGRLMWQIEPLKFAWGKRKTLTPHEQRKTTYLLIKALDGWIGDRSRNTTGIYSYFCVIKRRIMQKLAVAFGMLRIYRGSQFFGRDL